MVQPKRSQETLRAAVEAYQKVGTIAGAAREMGIPRKTLSYQLREAEKKGMIEPLETVPNPPRHRLFSDVVARRKDEFSRRIKAGDGRTLTRVRLNHSGPFMLVILGDPHLDNPGTNLELWERWIAPLDRKNRIYGICLGDYLDNWLKFLGHLYGHQETTVEDAWVLLEGYLDQMARHMMASISGNHDDWSGTSDLLGQFMRTRGILHRQLAMRLEVVNAEGETVTIGMRHRFPGHSQWNAAHGVMKAARMGWRDDVLIGGDKHISGHGIVRCPDTGRLSHCFQVAAFKVIDDYADQLGLMDQHVSPGIALVIDPARPDTDPQRVTHFWEPEAAARYLESLTG